MRIRRALPQCTTAHLRMCCNVECVAKYLVLQSMLCCKVCLNVLQSMLCCKICFCNTFMCCKVCFCNTFVLKHSATARPRISCKHTNAETWTYKDICREIYVQSRGRRESRQVVQAHTRWLDTPRLPEPAPLPDSFPHTFHCVVDASFACFTQ